LFRVLLLGAVSEALTLDQGFPTCGMRTTSGMRRSSRYAIE